MNTPPDTPADTLPPALPPESPQVAIEDEMKRSYLDYAMSVIVARALPDVRAYALNMASRVLLTELKVWDALPADAMRVIDTVRGAG